MIAVSENTKNAQALQVSPKREILKTVGKDVKTSAPRVSVIIPAYNVAGYIAETLDSVMAQTFDDLETIIVNDGSSDTEKLEAALAPYLDRIIYIKQPNGGAAAARNTGINAARGALLAFLDGDDIWLKNYLAEQVKVYQASGMDMIYCNAYLFGDEKRYATYMGRSPSHGEVTAESLLAGDCNVITSGTIASREKVLACGAFDEAAPARIEDFDLWFRLLKNGARIGYQKTVLLKYRVRREGLSGGSIKIAERTLIALDEVKRKHQLTDGEKSAWQKQYSEAETLLEVEKGKQALVEKDFPRAAHHFTAANKNNRSPKFSLITALVKYFPKAALWLFRNFRAEEARGFEADKNQ